MVRKSALLVLLLCSCAKTGPAGTPSPPAKADGPSLIAASVPPTGPSLSPSQSDPDGGFVASFERNDAEINPAVAAILDEAIRDYRSTGHTTVRVAAPPDDADDVALSERRAVAISDYLVKKGVWSRAVVMTPAGAWQPWTMASMSSAIVPAPILLLGPRPALPPTATPGPPPSPPPPRPPSSDGRPSVWASSSIVPPRAGTTRLVPSLSAVRPWLEDTGTLTTAALAALNQACLRLEGEVTAACQSVVSAGEGEFAVVPNDARAEYSYLLDSCRGAGPGESCPEIIGLEREFRSLPRGRLDPQPRTMLEDRRTRFTAFITYDGKRAGGGGAGRPIDDSAGQGKSGAGDGGTTIIPFSRRMCFGLAADPEDFRIVPVGESCMDVLSGGSRVKYNPQWDVTPLRAGTLQLRLVTELYVNSVKKEFRHEPYPLPIEVKPKLSLWDRIDNAIKRATGTVNMAVGLAEAIGTFFTVIAGWAIWTYFKKRRRSRKPAAPKKGRKK